MKALFAVGILAVTASLGAVQAPATTPAPSGAMAIAGDWLLDGKAEQPCAIFRQGVVLLIVNERGDLATGRMDGGSKLG